MRVQLIQDSNGKATGVYIPINDWNKLKKKHKDIESVEENESIQILKELKQAMIELKLIETGKLKAKSLNRLLSEL